MPGISGSAMVSVVMLPSPIPSTTDLEIFVRLLTLSLKIEF